jgi:hypothetical protein
VRAAIEDECSACHMPMTRYSDKTVGAKSKVFAHLDPAAAANPTTALALDGVSCTLCHQITPEGLGSRASFTAGFSVDTRTPAGSRADYGPFLVQPGQTRIMRSASNFVPTSASHLHGSELCASCHTLITTAFGPDGKAVGELPEQVPYLEWKHSSYRDKESCQSCHMPVVQEPIAISSVLGVRREGLARHDFRGANFFLPRLFNLQRTALGVQALPQELDATAGRARDLLAEKTANLTILAPKALEGRLTFEVAIQNLAGHKLPTGYPSRRAWLHVTVGDVSGRTVFESGALGTDGRIAGNDNDEDPLRFEPHHDEIANAAQVQIYEAILGDPQGAVTTGLLTGVRYLKDNRLLPRGFDKASAPDEIAVQGEARQDADFAAAGDRVRFRVDLGTASGPFQIEAELLYQPIAYRWAHNLAKVNAPEATRFVALFASAARSSATRIARATASIP